MECSKDWQHKPEIIQVRILSLINPTLTSYIKTKSQNMDIAGSSKYQTYPKENFVETYKHFVFSNTLVQWQILVFSNHHLYKLNNKYNNLVDKYMHIYSCTLICICVYICEVNSSIPNSVLPIIILHEKSIANINTNTHIKMYCLN